jgi:hypothetical protein
MVINALYGKYFQKSKIFLYPILDIKKGLNIVPTETYFSWYNKYSPEDMKLVCVYNTPNTPTFLHFEKEIVLKHNRLCDYCKVDSTTSIYVFDFSDLKSDWHYLIIGAYSKINDELKRKILSYFKDNTANIIYITGYLYPEKYFSDYAKILDVDISLLKEVGELCSKPNMEKEKLLIDVSKLESISDSSLSL